MPLIGLGLFGAAAFVIAMIATLPASLFAGSLKLGVASVAGTAWSGEALLRGGDLVTWRLDPVGSILSFGASAEIAVTGGNTNLTGTLLARPGAATLSNINGVAGWTLVKTAWPELDLSCDIAIRVKNATATLGDRAPVLSGEAAGSEGTCIDGSGKQFAAPATQARAETRDGLSEIRIALADDPSGLLADMSIASSGDIRATLLPRALALIPGANASGPVTYEMQTR